MHSTCTSERNPIVASEYFERWKAYLRMDHQDSPCERCLRILRTNFLCTGRFSRMPFFWRNQRNPVWKYLGYEIKGPRSFTSRELVSLTSADKYFIFTWRVNSLVKKKVNPIADVLKAWRTCRIRSSCRQHVTFLQCIVFSFTATNLISSEISERCLRVFVYTVTHQVT